MKRTATDLEDTFSTWKGKGKAEDDVDAEATRNTGRSRSGSLSLYRPATIATPEAVTSTFLKENQTVSGSNDPTTSIHQDSGQVLGKRRASTDLFEENYSAVASDHSFHALQDYNNLFPAVQGDMYPPYTSLLNQHDGTADVVPYQALPPAVGHTLSSNIGSFNNAAYVPSTGFDIPLKGEVEGPSISQHPSPMPPRAHSDYHGHVNEVPLTQRWLNPHLYYRNDANYDYASPGMSQPNDARLNGPPNVHAQPSYFNNGNGAVHAQSSQNYHIYGNGTSRDGIAVSQYPTAPGRPQPNNAHNGSVYHPQSPHKHGMGSQAPRHFRGLQYGFNMTPTTVYPTHAQHHAVGQNVDNAHQAPSNVVLAPRSPAIKRVESTAPSSNSTVSTPGSSSSGSSRSQSDEPEEILFVTEDVVCQWVISGPGEPIQTCDRLMKPDENPADHVRQFHSPEYRQGTHEWYCKWLTCQNVDDCGVKKAYGSRQSYPDG
ncbi:hypothetical protein MPER_09807 [Moniliophthora perniciosa FA553]|nr:hypothetical protein MPER_09807 [Moniliophthora perniciosa FA553]